jgi:RNA polymerase sigma factor (sigma-70 family)
LSNQINHKTPELQEFFIMVNDSELIPHLFRTEYHKITSVLCRLFGIEHIEIAEDIASETFLLAMETWPYKGLPENPVGWLYLVAKNKARNYLKRDQLLTGKIAVEIKTTTSAREEIEIDLSEKNIKDSQLQMLFTLCHPSIPTEAQIGLALRILCGFGIEEIATAFLTSKETINKRLYRAKEKLRAEKIAIAFPSPTEMHQRLETVLITLYLLFNEGYYSESQDRVLREELCFEAMRLTRLLIENGSTNLPAVNALFALMCFHASRFEARKNNEGEMVLYEEQDETKWDQELISEGVYFLREASKGNQISRYHLEAGIAYWHTIKTDTKEKWESVLHLYNLLLQIEYSPIAALNRTYAVSKVKGKEAAIAEAEKLNLSNNHFYFTLLGELYRDVDDSKARMQFQKALSLAKTKSDKQIIQNKIDQMETSKRNNN